MKDFTRDSNIATRNNECIGILKLFIIKIIIVVNINNILSYDSGSLSKLYL